MEDLSYPKGKKTLTTRLGSIPMRFSFKISDSNFSVINVPCFVSLDFLVLAFSLSDWASVRAIVVQISAVDRKIDLIGVIFLR